MTSRRSSADNASWGAALSAGIEQQRQDGPITTPITDAELSPKLTEVGERQYVVPSS